MDRRVEPKPTVWRINDAVVRSYKASSGEWHYTHARVIAVTTDGDPIVRNSSGPADRTWMDGSGDGIVRLVGRYEWCLFFWRFVPYHDPRTRDGDL